MLSRFTQFAKTCFFLVLLAGGFTDTATAGRLYFNSAIATTWDNGTTQDWALSSTGAYTSPWLGGSDANFQGTAGNVTVSGNIASVNSLNFDVSGYTLSGGGINLTGSGGTVNVLSGGIATINSVLSGSVGLTKTGSGLLTLPGNNVYTGTTTVSGGSLQVGNGGTAGALGPGNLLDNSMLMYNFSTAATVSMPATPAISGSGNLAATAGLIQLSGDITVGGSQSYVQVGGGSEFTGIELLASPTLTGSAVTLSGDVGMRYSNLNYSLTVDTNAANGPINLDISLGRNNVWFVPTSFTANAGSGPINVTGTGPGSAGWRSTPVTLIGAVNITANVNSNALVTIDATANGSVSGVLSGNMPLTLAGTGTLTLTASNTYAGATTISGGVLQVGNSGSGASIGGTSGVLDNAALVFNHAGNVVFAPVISGSGSLTQTGAGMLTLTANNTYTGATAISGGTLQIGNGGSGEGLASSTIVNNAALVFNNGDTLVYGGAISGGGSLTKTGSGALILSGSNTYSGATTVSGGVLELLAGNSYSSYTAANGTALVIGGGSVNLTIGFVLAAKGASVLYDNATINGGYLRGPGAHVFGLNTTNNLSGTTINNGTPVQQDGTANFTDVSNAGQISNNATANLTWQGGNNASSGAITVSGSSTVNVSGGYNDGLVTVNGGGVLNNSVSDLASGGGSRIYVNSGGTLNADINADGVTLDLEGSLLVNNGIVTGTTNVYYGATVQGSGTFGPVIVQDGGVLSTTATANSTPASLAVSSGSIAGAGQFALPVTVDEATFATPAPADTLRLSGDLSGPGPIIKTGEGLLVLSGDNSYGGGTIVTAGTLQVTAPSALLDGSSLTVGDAAAFTTAATPATVPATQGVVAVPEPGTLVLLTVAICGTATLQRIRSCRKKQ